MAAVTGVMIVITLVLILDLLTRTVAESSASVAVPAVAGATEAAERDDAELHALLQRRDALAVRVDAALAGDDASAPVTQTQRDAAAEMAATVARQREELKRRLTGLRETKAELSARTRAQREAVASSADELAQVRAAIAEAARRVRVTLLAGDVSGKRRWFVRCGGGPLRLSRLDDASTLEPVDDFATAEALVAWSSRGRTPAGDAFVLLVEPAGVEEFAQLQQALRGRGFDVGWDIAPAAADVVGNASADGEAAAAGAAVPGVEGGAK